MFLSSKKLLITAGGGFFVILFFVFFMVFFDFRIAFQKKMVVESKKEMALYDKRINNLKEIKKSLARNQENYSKMESVFLEEDSLVVFIQEMESLARHCGAALDIKGVVFNSQNNKYPSFTIFLKGSFSSIYNYLYLLENSKYQVAFGRLNLQEEGDGSWGASLVLNFLSFSP